MSIILVIFSSTISFIVSLLTILITPFFYNNSYFAIKHNQINAISIPTSVKQFSSVTPKIKPSLNAISLSI